VGSLSSAVVQIGNATVTSLCIDVSDKDEAGTTHDIKLNYLTKSNDFWTCTLAGGAARASTACCNPTRTWKENTNQNGYEAFYVQFPSSSSSDGLRVGGVTATASNGTTIHYGTFGNDEGVDTASCTSTGGSGQCASFWVDGDGHMDCWRVKLILKFDGFAAPECIL